MIFNMSGGGGLNLNFRVVGNPQPTSPDKNTIWVDTDIEITDWHFSASEPSDYRHGTVWIKIADASSMQFNALKKNGIMAYPLSVKQYVDDAWVNKDVKTYQDSEWGYLGVLLYNNGDTCDELTGGYTIYDEYAEYGYTDAEFTDTRLELHVGGGSGGHVITNEAIDLTNISALYFVIDKLTTTSEQATLYFKASDTKITNVYGSVGSGAQKTWKPSTNLSNSKATITLDVSSIDGKKYISIGGASGLRLAEIDVNISEIRGEA